jgi:2-keto-4-pentenoate hydratase
MRAQFDWRSKRLAAGEKPVGWKVGFASPAARERMKTTAPLVGFLTDRSFLPSGAAFSLGGVKQLVVEPEIAIHMGSDLPAGANRAAAKAAIAAIGPAIELNDLDTPIEDVETVLTGNVFHRRVVLGPEDPSRQGARLDGLVARVKRDAVYIPAPATLDANTGDLIDIARHVADVISAFGETLRAGQFIICGSIVPPLFIEPDEKSVVYALDPIGEVAVRFAAAA